MPPIIKCRGGGGLCHGLCVGVRKQLVSANYRTNAWVDWGVTRGRFPSSKMAVTNLYLRENRAKTGLLYLKFNYLSFELVSSQSDH
jgi:hypothetical protein